MALYPHFFLFEERIGLFFTLHSIPHIKSKKDGEECLFGCHNFGNAFSNLNLEKRDLLVNLEQAVLQGMIEGQAVNDNL